MNSAPHSILILILVMLRSPKSKSKLQSYSRIEKNEKNVTLLVLQTSTPLTDSS